VYSVIVDVNFVLMDNWLTAAQIFEVAPLSLGIETVGGVMTPLIKPSRNRLRYRAVRILATEIHHLLLSTTHCCSLFTTSFTAVEASVWLLSVDAASLQPVLL
jgi:hypothetical protein